jgi:hypothetical protein
MSHVSKYKWQREVCLFGSMVFFFVSKIILFFMCLHIYSLLRNLVHI